MNNHQCRSIFVSITLGYLVHSSASAQSTLEPYTFVTIAGQAASGTGGADGNGSAARFNGPTGLALDSSGSVFVTDEGDNTVRKLQRLGTNWVSSTIAGLSGHSGSANGINETVRFGETGPQGVAVDSRGNVFLMDAGNATIRQLTPMGTNWISSTIAGVAGMFGSADGTNETIRFQKYAGAVAVDSRGDLFVADQGNNTIRKLTAVGTNWVSTTIAGLAGHSGSADGTNTVARFNGPNGVALDAAGDVYVMDTYNSTIRKLTPIGTNWVSSTIAGLAGHSGSADGTGSVARFNQPPFMTVDSGGDLFVSDQPSTVRKLTRTGTNWVVTTIAGRAGFQGSTDGTGSDARFHYPNGLAVDSAGNVYVADQNNNTIRQGFPALVIASSGTSFAFNDGKFGFDLSGQAGQLVVVEASIDLVNWLPLWTNTLSGPLHFSDPQSPGQSDRFYRAYTK